jgi:6-phospho-beta-glucosidase
VLLMTAPLSLLVRCANTAFPLLDVTGICELPWATLRAVCDAVDVPADAVQFEYAGVNHLGWFDRLQFGAENLIPRYASTRRGAKFPSADLIFSQNAIPLKYLRMHYEPADVLRRQRAEPPRAIELQLIKQQAMQCFSSGKRDEIVKALRRRATPWYSEAIAPFVAATAGRSTSTVFFLSSANEGYLSLLRPDDTLEQPFANQNGTLRKLPRRCELPPPLAHTLQRFVEYERSAAQAVLTNQLAACASVLSKHPWVRSGNAVGRLAADLIAAI